jgi:hypothetical protein
VHLARRHSAEAHERAAELFEQAALFDEVLGDGEAAAAYRSRAERSRRAALDDRASGA